MRRRPILIRYWASHFKSLGHAERIASYFAASRAAGWDCHLVASGLPADPAWLEPLHRHAVGLHYLPRARGNFDVRCATAARLLCRELDADVLHCDNTHTSPLIGATLAGVAVRLWTKHAMQPAFEQVRPPTLRERIAPAVRMSAMLATRVLPISRAIGDELVALGVSPAKVQVLPLPVAVASAAVPAFSSREARRQWGLERDHVVFGTVGRALPVKGWDVLIEAFAAIHGEFPLSRLLLVGSTTAREEQPFRARLDALLKSRGIDHAVVFTGHLTNINGALAAMDAFVVPSRAEGFSLALVEALTAGLPVVSTRVGIAPDIMTDGVHGLLVERHDAPSLVRALTALAADAALRQKFAAAAAGAVQALPSPDQHAQALLTLYESLLNRGATRSSVT